MRYQVPQFIGVEDKIFGPLTAKQFLYVGGAAGAGFIIWNLFPTIIALIIGIPLVALFLMFAFFKFDGWQPFVLTAENFLKFFASTRMYVWKKEAKKPEQEKKDTESELVSSLQIPKLSDSKLRDLSWSLDINENID